MTNKVQAVLKASSVALLISMAPVAAYAQAAQERLAESVRVAATETQNTRQELQSTIAILNALQSQKEGELRPAYERYMDAVAKTHSAASVTSKRFETMSNESKTYFASWQAELATIANKDIRKVSSKRLDKVQKEYADVLGKLDNARAAFIPMNSDLDDLAKALGIDLTPNGLKSLGKTVKKTNESLAAAQAPVINTLVSMDKLAADLTPTGSK